MAISLTTLQSKKRANEKFVVCTAYDATFAWEIGQAGIEVILVGDSLGMVIQGEESTLPVTVEAMAYHTRCVSRGKSGCLIMADMPFMSYGDPQRCTQAAQTLMQAGAHLVKLEGGAWLEENIKCLTRQGVPVCAHLGLTPQSVNKFGGYKVQGKTDAQAEELLQDARALVECGADLLLLECVPTELARRVTAAVPVPVIGIGAGADTDAQVLVLHDLLGLGGGRKPRFVRNFMESAESIGGALQAYADAVRNGTFPAPEHGFGS